MSTNADIPDDRSIVLGLDQVQHVWDTLRAKWTVFVGELHEVHVTATELRVRYLRLAEASLVVFKAMAADEPVDLHDDLFDQFLVEVGHRRAEEIMEHMLHLLDPEIDDMDGKDLIVAYHGADTATWAKPREPRLAPPSTLVIRHGRTVETYRYNRRSGVS